ADDDDSLLRYGPADDLHRGEERSGGDRGGPLDVVVEGAEAVAVALEEPAGVLPREVLELEEDVGPARQSSRDEGLDELVVLGSADALVLPADVQRIGEALRVVGADVEEDRQRRRRVQPRAGGVERELADRDAHSAGALVAEPEDTLAVGHDDRLDAVEARVSEDRLDAVPVRPRQEEAARVVPVVAELLAALPDGGRVDERQHL